MWIKKKLTQKKLRKSDARASIITYITERTCSMFHAGELIEALPTIDKVTIYRNIELLSSLDIIHSTVQKDGVQYYELHGPNHHHHAMCDGCTSQECVACEVPEVPNKHHSIVYSYTCDTCINILV